MKRLGALLLFVTITVPVFPRVLSYAPYTNQPARVGAHERATRHFVTIEGHSNYFYQENQVVLYDSAGVEEPRVVFPTTGFTSISRTALYEPKGHARPPSDRFAQRRCWQPLSSDRERIQDVLQL